MPNLPPPWYSRLERFLICNKVGIIVAIVLLAFLVIPFLEDDEPLDSVLADGIIGRE